MESCFIIKSGVASLESNKIPLSLKHPEDLYTKINENKKMCLGLNEGLLSKTLSSFHFAEVSTGEWVGEDSIFNDYASCNYSLIAKTKLVLLEISTADLKKLITYEYK